MRSLIYYLIFGYINITLACNYANAQCSSDRDKIFPYLANQISIGDTSICITRDNLRLNDSSKFFSVFLFYGNKIIDSLSLSQDSISSTGAHPKSLFVWHTNDGGNFACLEYNEGSGVGTITVTQTELFIIAFSKNRLRIIGHFGTDSVFYNAREQEVVEINSHIDCVGDTLHIFREGWRMRDNNKKLIKVRKIDLVTYVYWTGKNLISKISSKFSYFIRGW